MLHNKLIYVTNTCYFNHFLYDINQLKDSWPWKKTSGYDLLTVVVFVSNALDNTLQQILEKHYDISRFNRFKNFIVHLKTEFFLQPHIK